MDRDELTLHGDGLLVSAFEGEPIRSERVRQVAGALHPFGGVLARDRVAPARLSQCFHAVGPVTSVVPVHVFRKLPEELLRCIDGIDAGKREVRADGCSVLGG